MPTILDGEADIFLPILPHDDRMRREGNLAHSLLGRARIGFQGRNDGSLLDWTSSGRSRLLRHLTRRDFHGSWEFQDAVLAAAVLACAALVGIALAQVAWPANRCCTATRTAERRRDRRGRAGSGRTVADATVQTATRPAYQVAERSEAAANALRRRPQLGPGQPNEHPLMPALRWAYSGLSNVEKIQDYSATRGQARADRRQAARLRIHVRQAAAASRSASTCTSLARPTSRARR